MKWLVIMALGVLVAGVPASAALNNAGFETGDLTGWTASAPGSGAAVAVVAAAGPWGPSEGCCFALLNTDLGTDSNEWTSVGQLVNLGVGDTVSLDYFFNDTAYSKDADGLVILLAGGGGAPDIEIVSLAGSGDNTPAGIWVSTTSAAVAVAGDYELKAKIRDGGTRTIVSYLGVDNCDVQEAASPGPEPGVIPEPLTMLAGLFGLTGVAGYVRKRRMK